MNKEEINNITWLLAQVLHKGFGMNPDKMDSDSIEEFFVKTFGVFAVSIASPEYGMRVMIMPEEDNKEFKNPTWCPLTVYPEVDMAKILQGDPERLGFKADYVGYFYYLLNDCGFNLGKERGDINELRDAMVEYFKGLNNKKTD